MVNRGFVSTHNLGCTQSDFLVVFLVLSLDRHGLDTLVDLLGLCIKLLDCRASSLGFDLACLVLLLELLLHVCDGGETLFEFRGLHLLVAIGNALLVVFLELLVDLGPLLLDQEGLVLIDPFLIKILIDFEESSSSLLFQCRI